LSPNVSGYKKNFNSILTRDPVQPEQSGSVIDVDEGKIPLVEDNARDVESAKREVGMENASANILAVGENEEDLQCLFCRGLQRLFVRSSAESGNSGVETAEK
jgi:hypothetical protein